MIVWSKFEVNVFQINFNREEIMKKVYYLVFSLTILLIFNGVVFGAEEIVVSKPSGQDNWKLGSTETIEWKQMTDPSINTPGFFKVVLRQSNSNYVACTIKLSYTPTAANQEQGLFKSAEGWRWKMKWDKVGYCKQGEDIVVQPGEYYIAVTNLVTHKYNNSDPFTIYELKAQQVPDGVKKAKLTKAAIFSFLVTSPQANNSWRLGSTNHYIKWQEKNTKGVPGSYKITLRQNNQEVGVINPTYTEDNENNNVYYFNMKWNKVGYFKNGGTADSGKNYKIRVRNKGTNSYRDSPVFAITELRRMPVGVKRTKPTLKESGEKGIIDDGKPVIKKLKKGMEDVMM